LHLCEFMGDYPERNSPISSAFTISSAIKKPILFGEWVLLIFLKNLFLDRLLRLSGFSSWNSVFFRIY
jgi:hypothetical protein